MLCFPQPEENQREECTISEEIDSADFAGGRRLPHSKGPSANKCSRSHPIPGKIVRLGNWTCPIEMGMRQFREEKGFLEKLLVK